MLSGGAAHWFTKFGGSRFAGIPEFALLSYSNLRNSNGLSMAFAAVGLFLYYVSTRSNGEQLPRYFDFALIATFFVLPVLLLNLVQNRSPASVPVMIIYFALGVLAVSTGERSVEKLPHDDFQLAAMTAISLAGLALIIRREKSASSTQFLTGQRLNERVRIDKLVRIRLLGQPRGGTITAGKSVLLFATCVVVRDVSYSGIGLYGFPEDIERMQKCFEECESLELEFIYHHQAHRVAVDFRWSKSDPSKGELGFQFVTPQQAVDLVSAVVGAAGNASQKKKTGHTAEHLFPNMFGVVVWAYSLLGLISLAF